MRRVKYVFYRILSQHFVLGNCGNKCFNVAAAAFITKLWNVQRWLGGGRSSRHVSPPSLETTRSTWHVSGVVEDNHTWDAKVKLERLALTGVLGEEQLAVNKSSFWRLVLFRIGSDKDLWILGRELIKFSNDTKTFLKAGLSSLVVPRQLSSNLRNAFGVSVRNFSIAGFSLPQPTMNKIWSLLFMWL